MTYNVFGGTLNFVQSVSCLVILSTGVHELSVYGR